MKTWYPTSWSLKMTDNIEQTKYRKSYSRLWLWGFCNKKCMIIRAFLHLQLIMHGWFYVSVYTKLHWDNCMAFKIRSKRDLLTWDWPDSCTHIGLMTQSRPASRHVFCNMPIATFIVNVALNEIPFWMKIRECRCVMPCTYLENRTCRHSPRWQFLLGI